MFSKILALLFVLSIFVFGCTQQQPDVPQEQNTVGQELDKGTGLDGASATDLAGASTELDAFSDELAEMDNSLTDAGNTDELQVLQVNDEVFG